jgi:glutamate dehydrogenase
MGSVRDPRVARVESFSRESDLKMNFDLDGTDSDAGVDETDGQILQQNPGRHISVKVIAPTKPDHADAGNERASNCPTPSTDEDDPARVPTVALMCDAAHRGAVEEIRVLLSGGASATQGDYDQRTPLHLAASGGSLDCVKFLVNAGATMKQDRFGCLPIHDAVRYGHRDIANFLREVRFGGNLLGSQADEMMAQVFQMIVREGIFSVSTVQVELAYFWNDLGMPPLYFKQFTLAQIAFHVQCYLAAKMTSLTTRSAQLRVAVEDERSSLYMSTLGHSREIEEALSAHLSRCLAHDTPRTAVSLVMFRSTKPARQDVKKAWSSSGDIHRADSCDSQLMFYATECEDFVLPLHPLLNEDDLQLVGSKRFLMASSPSKLQLYQRVMYRLLEAKSAVISAEREVDSSGSIRVIYATYEITGSTYLKELCQVFRCHGLYPMVMTMESFANGAIIYDMLLPTGNAEKLSKLTGVVRSLSAIPFLAAIPREGRPILDAAMDATITFGHAQWLLACVKFCSHFFPKETPEYLELSRKLRADAPSQAALDALHLKSVSELLQEDRVYEVLAKHLSLTAKMYENFKEIGMGLKEPCYNKELAAEVEANVSDMTARQILLTVLTFNAHLRMTNFFKDSAYPGWGCDNPEQGERGESTRRASLTPLTASRVTDIQQEKCELGFEATVPAALAYRFEPSFLKSCGANLYPEVPYAIYMVVGRDFHGFHVRFRDIARGGIRLILSRNQDVYKVNCSRLFEEAYNLAYTQQKKNKDIPEGGAKGTILLQASAPQNDNARRAAFLSYLDALLDCMGCGGPTVHSWLKGEEIMFFGPDENTAGFMDLGALRARRRGYRYWKAITTGKSTALGGVPHDVYGMTTASVHTYVQCLLEELGLDETQITKVQTGGPDGDLGSNEILVSRDKTVGVVDGSGVGYDPEGLDREELTRLARARCPIAQFRRSCLSAKGFIVRTDENSVVLPDGTQFRSGVAFRDTFHLSSYWTADLFVPCGGRPSAVHRANVDNLFTADGQPKFKYVVEGANLFFTPDARRVLENAGVKLFKDASTNKGGVTSSSLEVFAALGMSEADHTKNMCVQDGMDPPEFYQKYTEEILSIVRRNARMEFSLLWPRMQSGETSATVTDEVSEKINKLRDTIFNELMENPDEELIEKTLRRAVPPVLLGHAGYEALTTNTPRQYLLAICATYLASQYVYMVGLDASEFRFYQFMRNLLE